MRYENLHKKFPPLWVWMISLLITSGLLFFVLKYFQTAQDKYSRKELHELRQAELLEVWEADTSSYKVAVVGASLTWAGVENRQYFREQHDLSVYKIWYAGAYSETFMDELDLESFLTVLKPDLLLVDESVFLFHRIALDHDMVWHAGRASRKFRSFFLPSALRNQIGGQAGPLLSFDEPHPLHQNLIELDTLHFDIRDYAPRDFETDTNFQSMIRNLQVQGIHQIILNIPRPALVEESVYRGDNREQVDENYRRYEEEVDLYRWDYDTDIPFRYFRDYSHLNWEGAKIYSDWLANRIQNVKEGQ